MALQTDQETNTIILYLNRSIYYTLACMCVQLFTCLYVADECNDLISQERVVGNVANALHFSMLVGCLKERSRVWLKGG